MSGRTDFIMKRSFKDDPDKRVLKLHRFFQYASPLAITALLAYLIATLFYNPPSDLVLASRILLASFFTIEFAVEFILYESKKKFFKNYWWRAALFIPIIGFLRILGQLAQLAHFLPIVKMVEKISDTIDYYKSKWNK